VKAPSYEKVFLCSTEDEEKLQNKEKQLCLSVPEQPRISKEPSVKYRGFFINDEWPCFGVQQSLRCPVSGAPDFPLLADSTRPLPCSNAVARTNPT
jgi:hypothetical protein